MCVIFTLPKMASIHTCARLLSIGDDEGAIQKEDSRAVQRTMSVSVS